jgi:hypothetical protein
MLARYRARLLSLRRALARTSDNGPQESGHGGAVAARDGAAVRVGFGRRAYQARLTARADAVEVCGA